MSFATQLKNLGFTTGLGMVARMASGATPREAIRTAGTTALVGKFVDDEEIATSVVTAVDVLATQRTIANTVDKPVPLGHGFTPTSVPNDDYRAAQVDLLNLIRQIDFGEYDDIIDAIIDGFAEVKIAIRQMKDADENAVSTSSKDLL